MDAKAAKASTGLGRLPNTFNCHSAIFIAVAVILQLLFFYLKYLCHSLHGLLSLFFRGHGRHGCHGCHGPSGSFVSKPATSQRRFEGLAERQLRAVTVTELTEAALRQSFSDDSDGQVMTSHES